MRTYSERLEATAIPTHEDGLAAYCEFRDQWELETNYGTEAVPCDVADIPDMSAAILEALETAECDDDVSESGILLDVFGDFIEGREVYSGERVSRWCAHWSMPGYLDRGSDHCADTEAEALMILLEYDGRGEPLAEGISEWEHDVLERLAELADSGDPCAIAYLDHCGLAN